MTSDGRDEPAGGQAVTNQEPSRRLVVVHAHPDDETLTMGFTIARYAGQGAEVTVVTCTRGEEGEVIPPGLAHLTAAGGEALGVHRVGELDEAMRALGVRDHRILGDGRWRDSGMAWLAPGIAGHLADDGAAGAHPAAFVRADLEEAAGLLADVLREVRPQAVVTYDPQGGYGHPDHVMAHRVTTRAVERAREGAELAGWAVQAVHWVQVASSWALAERRALLAAATDGRLPTGMTAPDADADFPPAVVPDASLDVVIEAPEELAAVTAALRAHATQVRVDGPWYALSNGVAHRISAREGFRRVSGPAAAIPGRHADDLFAGLDIYPPQVS